MQEKDLLFFHKEFYFIVIKYSKTVICIVKNLREQLLHQAFSWVMVHKKFCSLQCENLLKIYCLAGPPFYSAWLWLPGLLLYFRHYILCFAAPSVHLFVCFMIKLEIHANSNYLDRKKVIGPIQIKQCAHKSCATQQI